MFIVPHFSPCTKIMTHHGSISEFLLEGRRGASCAILALQKASPTQLILSHSYLPRYLSLWDSRKAPGISHHHACKVSLHASPSHEPLQNCIGHKSTGFQLPGWQGRECRFVSVQRYTCEFPIQLGLNDCKSSLLKAGSFGSFSSLQRSHV